MTAVVVRRNNREKDTIGQMRGIASRMFDKMMNKNFHQEKTKKER